MKISKRHAKPTTAALLNRLYRRQIAENRDAGNQLALMRLDMQRLEISYRAADDATGCSLAAHVAENDALRARCDRQDQQMERLIGLMQQFADRDRDFRQMTEANQFMADQAKADHVPVLNGERVGHEA